MSVSERGGGGVNLDAHNHNKTLFSIFKGF